MRKITIRLVETSAATTDGSDFWTKVMNEIKANTPPKAKVGYKFVQTKKDKVRLHLEAAGVHLYNEKEDIFYASIAVKGKKFDFTINSLSSEVKVLKNVSASEIGFKLYDLMKEISKESK
jgi:hypothetical protein